MQILSNTSKQTVLWSLIIINFFEVLVIDPLKPLELWGLTLGSAVLPNVFPTCQAKTWNVDWKTKQKTMIQWDATGLSLTYLHITSIIHTACYSNYHPATRWHSLNAIFSCKTSKFWHETPGVSIRGVSSRIIFCFSQQPVEDRSPFGGNLPNWANKQLPVAVPVFHTGINWYWNSEVLCLYVLWCLWLVFHLPTSRSIISGATSHNVDIWFVSNTGHFHVIWWYVDMHLCLF